MMLGQLGAHGAAHNWFAAGVDVVVLVIGIFLGVQASNWNQARIDRDRGHDYRLRLIDDIHADEQQLASQKRYFDQVRLHAKQALAALDRPVDPADGGFLIDAYQASQITPTGPARATYDEIVSTGNVENLGQAALRAQVANYYIVQAATADTLGFVPPYREHIRQAMPSPAQEAIRRQCADIWRLGTSGLYRLELPPRCTLELDRADLEKAVIAVRGLAELRSDLNRVVADLDGKVTVVDALLLQAQGVRDKITKADG